jgi:hypothetical protein
VVTGGAASSNIGLIETALAAEGIAYMPATSRTSTQSSASTTAASGALTSSTSSRHRAALTR